MVEIIENDLSESHVLPEYTNLNMSSLGSPHIVTTLRRLSSCGMFLEITESAKLS